MAKERARKRRLRKDLKTAKGEPCGYRGKVVGRGTSSAGAPRRVCPASVRPSVEPTWQERHDRQANGEEKRQERRGWTAWGLEDHGEDFGFPSVQGWESLSRVTLPHCHPNTVHQILVLSSWPKGGPIKAGRHIGKPVPSSE